VGFTETLRMEAGVTVNVAVCGTLFNVPVMVAVFVLDTATVFTVNVIEVAPTGTVTLAGTVAQLMLDESVTTVPPVGAGPLMVTVPVDEVPPWTEVGFTLTLTNAGGVIASGAVSVVPARVAEMVAFAVLETAVVRIVKVAVVCPADTVTEPETGTVALALFEDRVTTVPPLGAAALSVTVPDADVPPTTEAGVTPTLTRVGGLDVPNSQMFPSPCSPPAVVVP